MYLKKLLSSYSGFSMTELMVGVGLLGGVSLVTMKVMQENAGNEAYLNFTAKVNSASMLIQNAMNNAGRCNEMVVGQVRGTSLPYLRISKGGAAYEVLLQENTEYADFFVPSSGIQLTTSTLGSNISEIVLTFKTRRQALLKGGNASNLNKGMIVKRIPFVTELTGTMIKSCGPVVSDADAAAKEVMCRSLGAAATWSGGVCTLVEMKCPAGQVPSQMTSMGKVICVSVLNPNFRDTLFDYGPTTCAAGQTVTLVAGAGGKIKAGCAGTALNCPATTLTWTAGNIQCSAAFSATAFGASQTQASTLANTSGSATYLCNTGLKAWSLSGTPTCVSTSYRCAAGQVVNWSGATKFCSVTTATLYEDLVKVQLTSNAAASSGAGTTWVECNKGVLSVIPPTTCN